MVLTHYTDKRNLKAIKESGILKCALSLMTLHGRLDLAKKKRRRCEEIASGVVLRDQSVLNKNHLKECTMGFDEFVEYLNGHVFFWADTIDGNKKRHGFREKYKYPAHVGLRCNLDDFSPDAKVLCASYNSGYAGKWIPFCPIELHDKAAMVEAVVPDEIQLPCNTQKECDDGEWRNFFCC